MHLADIVGLTLFSLLVQTDGASIMLGLRATFSSKVPRSLGCFKDSDGLRDLSVLAKKGSIDTVMCMYLCRGMDYKFFGLQAGTECWCGNSYRRYGPAPAARCNMKCSGASAQNCGGKLHNRIFPTRFAAKKRKDLITTRKISRNALGLKMTNSKYREQKHFQTTYKSSRIELNKKGRSNTRKNKTTKRKTQLIFRKKRLGNNRHVKIRYRQRRIKKRLYGKKRHGKKWHGKKLPRKKWLGMKHHGIKWHRRKWHGKKQHGKKRYGKKRYGKKRHGKKRYGKKRYGKKRYGKKRYGKKWHGKKLLRNKWLGMKHHGIKWHRRKWHGKKQHGKTRYGKKRYGKKRYGKKRYGKKRYGKKRYGKKRYGKKRYGKNQLGMKRFGGMKLDGKVNGNRPVLKRMSVNGRLDVGRASKAVLVSEKRSGISGGNKNYVHGGTGKSVEYSTSGSRSMSTSVSGTKSYSTGASGSSRSVSGDGGTSVRTITSYETKTTVIEARGLGCFKDSSPRDLPVLAASGPMTVDKCMQACTAKRHRYFGLQFGRECWCGDSYGKHGAAVDDSNCAMKCSGNKAEICGGSFYNSVYDAGKV